MRGFWLVCFLVGASAWAQTNAPVPQATPISPPSRDTGMKPHNIPPLAASIASDSPVLIVKGLCEQMDPGARPANSTCETVVTRAQFESLIDALQPEMGSETKSRLATSYPQFLIMAHEAENRGLDKQPRFQQKLAFVHLQILSQELVRQIQEQAAQVPDKDIQDYYQRHSSDFEQASLERIVVPIRRQLKNPQAGTQENPGEDEMTREAEALRARAVAGEDFSNLQREAYDAAGVSGNSSPHPRLGNLRRRGLPPAHAAVFDLKPGEVSQMLSDATGHYIYKLDSKEIEPLDGVKREITIILRRQRAEKMIQSIQEPFTTDMNHAYFGSETGTGDGDTD
jgi:PPIC-type PPIASE domain